MQIVSNPRTFKIPDWFLNRQKDHKDGRFSQLTSSALDTKLREDLERLKKIRWAGFHHFEIHIGLLVTAAGDWIETETMRWAWLSFSQSSVQFSSPASLACVAVGCRAGS